MIKYVQKFKNIDNAHLSKVSQGAWLLALRHIDIVVGTNLSQFDLYIFYREELGSYEFTLYIYTESCINIQ